MRQDAGQDSIAERLRAARLRLGLSLAEVARRAGIRAPSFVHHIEHGLRLPSEAVAQRLARVLGEDEELVRAWVAVRGGCDLRTSLEASRVIRRALEQAEPSTSGDTANPAAIALMRVPRYEEGVDPGTLAEPGREVAETLRFDPASLPREAWLKPFAYRLTSSRSLPTPLRTNDLIVITRNAWPIQLTSIYVARAAGAIVIGRLEWRPPSLWLHLDDRAPEPLEPSGAPPRALLGRVAAVIRDGLVDRAKS